jgi:hypothetical protein
MNADMLNRGTENHPSLSLSLSLSLLFSFFRGGGRTSPPPPSGSATGIRIKFEEEQKHHSEVCSVIVMGVDRYRPFGSCLKKRESKVMMHLIFFFHINIMI